MNDLHTSSPPVLDVVILSAGQSRRLGQPKQHVILAGQTLLQRSLNLALSFLSSIGSQRKPIVVSGAYLQQDCQLIERQFHAGTISHHYNHDWRTGMASSMDRARVAAGGDGMMVILVDQYQLTLSDLNSVYTQWLKKPAKPVAARFANTVGPPVIWPIDVLTKRDPAIQDGRTIGLGTRTINKTLLNANNPTLVDLEHASIDLDNDTDLQAARAFFTDQKST